MGTGARAGTVQEPPPVSARFFQQSGLFGL
jgi:hypothetical protein